MASEEVLKLLGENECVAIAKFPDSMGQAAIEKNQILRGTALKLRYAVMTSDESFLIVNVQHDSEFLKKISKIATALNCEYSIVGDAGMIAKMVEQDWRLDSWNHYGNMGKWAIDLTVKDFMENVGLSRQQLSHRRDIFHLMKYEDRKSQEYIDSIMELLIKDRGWLKDRRRCKYEDEHHQNLQLLARKVMANARFEHSKENIDKLLQLNKRLIELQDECAKVTFNMYKDMMALMAQGKTYYKTFNIETSIIYESEENWEGEISGLYDSYDKANRFEVGLSDAPGREPADYKELNAWHEDLSWNIETLDLPEFKDEYICFAMHKFFADGKYSLEDAMRMKPEDFYVHTEIHI